MEREKTEELLRKYYDGLASEEEETQLRNMPGTQAADGEFAPDRVLLSIGRAGVTEPSAEFMSNLEAVTLQGEHPMIRRKPYRYALSVAAGMALLLGSYYIFSTVTAREPADTFSDPELAMAKVRNILLNVSQNMNTGSGALSTVNTYDRSLRRLRYLNDLTPAAEEKDKNNE